MRQPLSTLIPCLVAVACATPAQANGFIAQMRGGDVVRQSFVGRDLRFGYIETLVRF